MPMVIVYYTPMAIVIIDFDDDNLFTHNVKYMGDAFNFLQCCKGVMLPS